MTPPRTRRRHLWCGLGLLVLAFMALAAAGLLAEDAWMHDTFCGWGQTVPCEPASRFWVTVALTAAGTLLIASIVAMAWPRLRRGAGGASAG
ncbi:MAG: hypothetical protein U0Y82_00680 [Thermoleophilia bacterium]